MLGFHYGYVPQIPKPVVEKYFTDTGNFAEAIWIPYPLTGNGLTYKRKETLLALCELSGLFCRVLHHNKADSVSDGSPEDINTRAQIYQELLDLKARYPVISDDLMNSTAHTYTMRLVHNPWETASSPNLIRRLDSYYYNAIALAAFRPLQLLPDVTLPNRLGTPKELCFEHASELISVAGQYRAKFSFKYNCGLTTAAPYVVAFTLLPQLDHSTRVAEPFTKACQYMREYVPRLDVLRYSLRALEALALLHNFHIPPDALQYFEGLGIDDASLENVPCTLVTVELPPPPTMGSPSSSPEDVRKVRGKIEAESMRELLARWNNINLQTPGFSRRSVTPDSLSRPNHLTRAPIPHESLASHPSSGGNCT